MRRPSQILFQIEIVTIRNTHTSGQWYRLPAHELIQRCVPSIHVEVFDAATANLYAIEDAEIMKINSYVNESKAPAYRRIHATLRGRIMGGLACDRPPTTD